MFAHSPCSSSLEEAAVSSIMLIPIQPEDHSLVRSEAHNNVEDLNFEHDPQGPEQHNQYSNLLQAG
jgi:hypothetical protein